jgi:DNA-binding beta-propeller fold protein YncE
MVLLTIAIAPIASATPVILEAGISLERSWSITDPYSVAFNPVDGEIYTSKRLPSGGVWKLNADGTSTKIVSSDRPLNFSFNPNNGDMFIAEDYDGMVLKVENGQSAKTNWLTAFGDTGDDDTSAVEIIPEYYTGSVLAKGTGICTDRGYLAADEVWLFDPAVADSEIELIHDTSGLDDPFDIVITPDKILIIDGKSNGETGTIFELTGTPGSYALTAMTTSEELNYIRSGVYDPNTGDILLMKADTYQEILRVDLDSGDVSTVMTGVDGLIGSLAMNADGSRLYVASNSEDLVYEFAIPEPATMALLAIGSLSMLRRRRR